MTTQDNETLYAEQKKVEQPQAEGNKTRNTLVSKLLAGAVGMAAGAGVAYATRPHDTEAATTAEQQDAAQDANPTMEERISRLEEKERLREQQEQTQEQDDPKVQDDLRDKPTENSYFDEHEVQIVSSEENTMADGTRVDIYYGTVDGHQAAFLGDVNGNIVAVCVDENNDGELDTAEITDLSGSHFTTQQLAEYRVEESNPDIQVLSVEHDVNIDGQSVDVAVVSVDNQQVVLLDTTHDNEADVLIEDKNNNGVVDEDEMEDVSGSHITMPTEDDIASNDIASNDDMNDYSNDADITSYEV